MHIAQVSHLYRPSIGGIENYVHRLNGSAREAGHSVTTYTTDLSLSNDDSPLETDDQVHYCSSELAPLRNPLSIDLYRQVRDSDADIYHLHNPWFLSTLVAATAIPDDVPTVMTVHSAQITSNNKFVRALNVAYKPLAEYIFDQVDHSFVQGETEKRRLLDRFDLPSRDVSVVPNGIHPSEYDVSEQAVADFQERYGLDPEVPTVLYVSRLIPEKNPSVFVDAISDHLGDRDVQALVIGDGEQDFVGDLRARADDRIQFLSNLEFETLKASYHASDLFVFLGTWEGLPTVILEAMNARLPIISTPVGAIADAVTDGENGTIVSSPPDARSVGTAIRYYLDLPGVRAEVGEHNRQLVSESYAWDGVADSILTKYKELV